MRCYGIVRQMFQILREKFSECSIERCSILQHRKMADPRQNDEPTPAYARCDLPGMLRSDNLVILSICDCNWQFDARELSAGVIRLASPHCTECPLQLRPFARVR